MNSEILFIIKMIQKELWRRWKSVLVVFVMTAVVFLAAAWNWPKVFSSSSVILVDQQTILSPLMQGTAAVSTEARNRSGIARQVVFSQRAMDQVIASEVWAGDNLINLSPREIDRIKNEIMNKANVSDVGRNLIEISFKDIDADKAYQTTKLLTDIFIQESINVKQNESSSAYNFIDEQVTIYQNKLRLAEDAIKEFRSKNIDATQGAKDNANARLVELKRELEGVELEISAESSSILGNKKRLSGQVSAETNSSFVKENELQTRISSLNTRLDELRLNYKETYPDIVQIKNQISLLEKSLRGETLKRETAIADGIKTVPTGAMAQELKRSILMSEAKIITLTAKSEQLSKLMDNERETLNKINEVEAEVAELNRDYNVNQNMYQDLLGQRENARVSMNMDIQNQGLSMRIQEPATKGVTPEGIRFSHIILAGLAASLLLPIGLVFGLTILDQKVRNESYIRDELRLPILAAVYNTKTLSESKHNLYRALFFIGTVISVWAIYGYAILLRFQG